MRFNKYVDNVVKELKLHIKEICLSELVFIDSVVPFHIFLIVFVEPAVLVIALYITLDKLYISSKL